MASVPANLDPQTLPLLDNDILQSFVAIAESGSFTRAAQQVFRTPAALSMQIKRLEAQLGQQLFIRQARKVSLTAEGEILLSYSRRLLKLNQEAVSQFLSPTLAGKVRFGMSDDVGTRILPSVLAQFARTHPGIQVDVVVGRSTTMIQQLDAGTLDLVLVTGGNEGQDESRGRVVHTEPLVWAGREGGIATQQSPLPVALADQGCVWRRLALTALDQQGIPYRISYVNESTAGQEAALIADLAVGPMPRSLIRPPLCPLAGSSGLPALGDYQMLMIQHPRSTPAATAIAGYVADSFAQQHSACSG